MEKVSPAELPIIVLIGELRQGNPVWDLPFDPEYKTTDGLYRALYMRLQRIMSSTEFELNKTYTLGSGEEVFLTGQSVIESSIVFCVVLKEGTFDNKLMGAIRKVADRGGVYATKKFYSEVQEMLTAPVEPIQVETLLPSEAFDYIYNENWSTITLTQRASILVIVGTDSQFVRGEKLYEFCTSMLDQITAEIDADVMLDSAFVIASRFLENQTFQYASNIFEKIAECAQSFERLALEISCRIRSARLLKLQGIDDGMEILNVLSPIDDGSLEAASHNDREEYYCLQAFAFSLLEDMDIAEDLYTMAIMISEAESFPTMNKAEAHAFIGTRASSNFNPESATREFLTASSIATRNGIIQMASFYSHLAAQEEIRWSKLLASSAIIQKMEANIDHANYESWQALKRLVNAVIHGDRERRNVDIFPEYEKIFAMVKNVLAVGGEDYALNTLNEIEMNFKNFKLGQNSIEKEVELLKFLSTKISAMIPLPTPIIMLIANDGRLVLGGEVGAESWENALTDKEQLFSGALSAIMAVLSEVISGESPLRMVDAGSTQIMIEKSKVCVGALLVDRDLHLVRKALQKVVEIMEYQYPDLENWDGYSLDFSDAKGFIDEIFAVTMKEIEQ
jgi:hypothetical protein